MNLNALISRRTLINPRTFLFLSLFHSNRFENLTFLSTIFNFSAYEKFQKSFIITFDSRKFFFE